MRGKTLLRQWNLRFSDEYIRNVGRKLNLRPRKRLGFSTPKVEFFKQIANFALAS